MLLLIKMELASYPLYDAEALRSKGLVVTEDPELKLAIVRYHKSENSWKIQKFGNANMNDSIVQKHRSVIYSLESKCVVHTVPIRRKNDKAVVIDTLKKSDWVVTPYIDGTMISVFWNHSTGEWILSTRSKFHASCKYMSDRIFRDLFCEALGVSLEEFLEKLDRDYSYTFVLTHPENKHVVVAIEPKVYLVHMIHTLVCTKNDGETFTKVFCHSQEEMYRFAQRFGVNTLDTIDVGETDESFRAYCHEIVKDSDNARGVMLLPTESNPNANWERIRILSHAFEHCAYLRGYTPSPQVNILRLWGSDPTGELLNEYVKHYPSEDTIVQDVLMLIAETSADLVLYYKNRHVRKTLEHTDLPHWTRKPIYDLHGMYLRERIPITKDRVIEYYRRLSPTVVNRIFKNREKELRKGATKENVSVVEE